MTPYETALAAELADSFSLELDDDVVELWRLPRAIRRAIGDVPRETILEISQAILDRLAASGVRLGDLSGDTGLFIPWSDPDGIQRALREWRALGRDPNMGDIGWLSREG